MVCNGHKTTCLVYSWLTCPQGCRQSIRVVWSSVGGCKETDPKRKAQGFQPGGEGFQQRCSLIEADPFAGAQTPLALEIKLMWAGRQWWGMSMTKHSGTWGWKHLPALTQAHQIREVPDVRNIKANLLPHSLHTASAPLWFGINRGVRPDLMELALRMKTHFCLRFPALCWCCLYGDQPLPVGKVAFVMWKLSSHLFGTYLLWKVTV